MARIADPTPAHIAEAAERLRAGEVIAFPTETVYGLGADTFDAETLETLYAMKGRPADNPLIAHVADAEAAKRVVASWDDRCERLTEQFWPGPLTLVVPKAHDVPGRATGFRPTIAVRAPSHPVARDLLSTFGGPVSAPSANRSGHVSATTARHVADDFARFTDLLILDGGPCELGLESTVLDLSMPTPAILRPGVVARAAIEDVIGRIEVWETDAQLQSPGTSPRHYAPRTDAMLVDRDAMVHALQDDDAAAAVLCFDASLVPGVHVAIEMPATADAYARRLYDALREADDAGVQRILIETPPKGDDVWLVVHDRLCRATAGG